jgi:MFS family permease
VTALSLAIAYGMALPLPFIAPVLALFLSVTPAPPMGVKGLFRLVLVMFLTLGIGLLLIPALIYYPVAGIILVGVGLYFSSYLSLSLGKGLMGTLLTLGFTIIPAAGVYDFGLAVAVIQALVIGMALAVVCLWVVYPLFPEEPGTLPPKPVHESPTNANWRALRIALIVLPPFIFALTNPSMYLKLIMKSVLLGQQGSVVNARDAGRELLGSTFMAGIFAILFWFLLKLSPTLWMFFLWTLFFGVYFVAKLFGLIRSRYPASYWSNVAVTMLILLGSAVQDSVEGDDVYSAFATRMSLFVAVTFYAWGAVFALERWRQRRPRGAANTIA